MAKDKIKIPKSLKGRLKAVAKDHKFDSVDALAFHFVDRGLKVYGAETGEMDKRIEQAVEDQGYSADEELIEHLLLRGLQAYEEVVDDPEALQERLRGLGYID